MKMSQITMENPPAIPEVWAQRQRARAKAKQDQQTQERRELWKSVAVAVAGSWNCQLASRAAEWADMVLEEYDQRIKDEKL
jgi:hypothetical protein